MPKKDSKELFVAKKAAIAAGRLLEKGFYSLKLSQIHAKGEKDTVTDYDTKAEKLILSHIKKSFPKHSILSEEAGMKNLESEYLWIVDPLDGTTNFSIKNPFFNVAISLLHKGTPILGVVYAPITKDLFWAEKGKGTFLNGKKVQVSQTADISKAFVTFCGGHTQEDNVKGILLYSEFKMVAKRSRQMGASELELALLSCGKVDLYYNSTNTPWDVAAGIVLIQEAGGKVTDLHGKPWHLECDGFLATNGKLHDVALEHIKKALHPKTLI